MIINQQRPLFLLAFAVALVALATGPSRTRAEPPPPHDPADVDRPFSPPFGLDGRALAQLGPNVRVLPGTIAPGPRMISRRDGALTGPSSDAPVAIVSAFLRRHADLYGLQSGAPAALIQKQLHVQHGVTHVRFAQHVGGLEAFQGDLKAALDAQGRLLALNGTVLPERPVTPPRLLAVEAMTRAVKSFDGLVASVPPVSAAASGPDGATTFAVDDYLMPPTARLVFFPNAAGGRTAWLVSLPMSVTGSYEVVVDASNGDLLYRNNLSAASGPEGEVFATSFDPDDGPPAIVPLVGSMPAPRNAWLPPGGTTTAGNNASSGQDRNGDLTGVPASSVTQHFDFGFSDSYETSGGIDSLTDQNASIVNGFYWANYLHDYYYALGFTETAGNFQADNFGAGGVGGDRVNVLIQFAADGCALPSCFGYLGYFLTLGDGIPGFIALKLAQPPQRYTDAGFLADLLIHEYTHGLSVRLVGGLGGIQSGALGEGWSDWFAGSLTDDPVMGEYQSGNYINGVNFYALSANPRTYGDVCAYGFPGCEVHKEGEIWSATLWDVRASLISAYGAPAGKAKAEQLVVDGMMFTPSSPTFLEARDGILQADTAAGGTDQCLLWAAFAARGMGESAVSFGDSSDVHEAFDLPLACAYAGPDGDGDGMPDSYETLHACLNGGVADGGLHGDADGATNGIEYNQRTDPCDADTDGDGYLDLAAAAHTAPANTLTSADNCPLVSNGGPSQPNNDGNFIDLTPPKSNDDKTWINSDARGDACDLDDDNDGISDAAEAAGCNTSGPLNPQLRDTDLDRSLDSVECALGTNPASATSKPTLSMCGATGDTDGDGVKGNVEYCYYGSNASNANTDGDTCTDGKEAATFDQNTTVNAADLGLVASAFGSYTAPPAPGTAWKMNMDYDKNGTINAADLGLVAAKFGACP